MTEKAPNKRLMIIGEGLVFASGFCIGCYALKYPLVIIPSLFLFLSGMMFHRIE